jgi:hypothetical protein
MAYPSELKTSRFVKLPSVELKYDFFEVPWWPSLMRRLVHRVHLRLG